MQNNKPVIIWEKWVDPYGQNLDSVEWPGYDSREILEENEQQDEEEKEPFLKQVKHTKINAIATTMGIIPYNEHTDCTKIFNFWLGHTNFDITKNIAIILENIVGVETLDIFTRYRFRISFGKAFSEREIIDTINKTISEVVL